MGVESLQQPKFYIELDGTMVEVGITNMEIAYPEIDQSSGENFSVFPGPYTVRVQCPKVNKKRFIKLLMARGIQRNGAEELARYVCQRYGYYNFMALLLIL